ncbi:MAG: exonuclease SbcCD subunit D [Zhenhengia sp.]|uniref:Nuclease SbcCD subunit D n=1 Tax=Zhenhengia yiwuensis TaxID=2763666 RepID=A0A926EMH4_9FIRM|nr:exonuclease SbcCD subunit D [Zhenhengia yiwuensis]MBC8580802.1 exonuclease SbcCD subunit D [Zhenhengia yiwuensis]MBS5800547.1 exonuclease SbcCD subunit D [Clostridiales bacterium]MDU6360885.1 exonuclease SbcCD subunit D [Clostridiales bacterium]MDY3366719.1 exonuclease SbcCD subunit D [Zhenhengia yiwuensis]
MKILHTSDWHLGRTLHGYSLIEDQAYMLDQLIEYMIQEKIELLIIAGDVYDKSLPNEEAVALFNQFISQVIGRLEIPTVIIAGNHDSNTRIHFGSELFASKHLYIVGECEKGYQQVTIEGSETIDVYLIPYMEPAYVREIAGDETIKRHDDAMRYLTRQIEKEKNDRATLLVVHAFVAGGDLSDSERRLCAVGTAEMVGADCFKPFTYTALGHLHKPQAIGSEHIRYSGSLLKYSISEANQPKCFVKLEIVDGQLTTLEEVSLKPKRDLKIVQGPIEAIVKAGAQLGEEERQDYVYAKIESKGTEDVVGLLKQIYPYTLGAEFVMNKTTSKDRESKQSEFEARKKKSLSELFIDFMDYVGETTFDEEETAYMGEVIKQIEEERK